MPSNTEENSQKLKEAGLKVTPQRLAILEAVYDLGNHPTAENIIEYIRSAHPGVATGTVYNVLDVLVENKLIRRVKTDKDAMRYDGILDSHHHLYCAETDRIEDYFDEELDHTLQAYFRQKEIPGFEIRDIILQVNGNYNSNK
jgi:Fur family peroxide stress response transcriptional regulator